MNKIIEVLKLNEIPFYFDQELEMVNIPVPEGTLYFQRPLDMVINEEIATKVAKRLIRWYEEAVSS